MKENKIRLAKNPCRRYNGNIAEGLPPGKPGTDGNDGRRRGRMEQHPNAGRQPGDQVGTVAEMRRSAVHPAALCFVFQGAALLTRENLSHKGEIMHGNYR